VILSDTVGFISDLPTSLVAAFRATLDDVKTADIIVHVHDASSPWHVDESRDVMAILNDLGIKDVPIVDVWNKADALSDEQKQDIMLGSPPILVSAQTGEGIPAFLATLDDILLKKRKKIHIFCPFEDTAHRAWLHEHGAETTEEPAPGGWTITTYLREESLVQAEKNVPEKNAEK
jgi:GTP-binding protein HflX